LALGSRRTRQFAVPFGRAQKEIPRQEVHIGDHTYVLDGEHAVLVGSHVYRWPTEGLVARHGIEVLLDRNGERERIVPGHDDRLVLL
jgi:hypothetical protein